MSKAEIIILKGDPAQIGAGSKMYGAWVAADFLKEVCGADVWNGNRFLVVTMDDYEGDASAMDREVFRYVELLGIKSDRGKDERVARLVEIYKEKRNGKDLAGWGILKRVLDKMYMQYDIRIIEDKKKKKADKEDDES